MDEATYVEGFHDDGKVAKMSYQELGETGMRVSKMSFGGGPTGGVYGPVGEEEAITTLQEALKSGLNYIDTAPWYGNGKSEEIIGKALKDIPRSTFYVGTKVGRYEPVPERMFDFSAERVFKSVDQSLKLLNLDYVDIIQVHDLEFAEDINQVLNETLPALQKIVEQGKARFIGITGYPLSTLRHVVENSTVKINTVLSYARNTLIDDELKKYIPFFQERGIGVINACAVGMGLLTSSGVMHWHPAGEEIKDAANDAVKYCKENGSDIAEVAIQYSLTTEGAHTHLIGAKTLDIFRKNFDTCTRPPTDLEIQLATDVRKKFFEPLAEKHWEGKDVEKYRQAMREYRGEAPKTQSHSFL